MSLWSAIKGGLKAIASAPLKLLGGAVRLPAQAISTLGGTGAQVLRAATDTARQVLPQLTQLAATAVPAVGAIYGGPLGGALGQVAGQLLGGGLGADRQQLAQHILNTAGQIVPPEGLLSQLTAAVRNPLGQLPLTGI